mmetsp:Transcript_10720/g.20042  ORF Transcript_10720/g.20042 Transcript_10720/m.20042 type:complete len:90 (+) Transcript_10720:355-624(+)
MRVTISSAFLQSPHAAEGVISNKRTTLPGLGRSWHTGEQSKEMGMMAPRSYNHNEKQHPKPAVVLWRRSKSQDFPFDCWITTTVVYCWC